MIAARTPRDRDRAGDALLGLEEQPRVDAPVVADDPDKYPLGTSFPPGVEVRPREELDAVQRMLRNIPDTTILNRSTLIPSRTRSPASVPRITPADATTTGTATRPRSPDERQT